MNTKLFSALVALTLSAAFPTSSVQAAEAAGDVPIPFKKFTLKNGLTLIVHEDHKAPIVCVNVWYHVGSKNERPGKTGFAHLFEHLMFNGSEHFDDDYFKATEKVGATELNGTTSEDRTDYFQNAPKGALDYLLWLESDRMGHLVGAINQAKLDEQRGVVQNEKRQGENQPYGRVEQLIAHAAYPPGHPYSWTVIGSMEDLNAASLDDVKEWFRTYYGAANATLVVAGDVNTDAVHEKVEKYFGPIPSGPPLARQEAWIAPRRGTHREVMQDRVPQARLYKVWNIPEFGTADGDYLGLVADVLATGKSSRLYRRLVYEDQIATDVSASAELSEIGGRFYIIATARPGESLKKLEASVDEEVQKFLAHGPTADELERIKAQNLAGFLRGIERIGGFGGKSDILAENQVFSGSPDHYRVSLQRMREATARQLQDAARRWLSDGVCVLEVQPFPKYETVRDTVDRSHLPVPTLKPEVKFPELHRATLANGLKIVLARRAALPLVNFTLLFDAGYAADPPGAPGTAKLTLTLMKAGTAKGDALRIDDQLARLGATLETGSTLDGSSVSLSALKANLEPSLDLFADVVLHPSFPKEQFERLRKLQLDAIHQEESEPASLALRVLPPLIYGSCHAYGIPLTGSGTTNAVEHLSGAKIEKFYQTWLKPNNATLIIAGDTTIEEILPKLERLFGGWKPGPVPVKNLVEVAPAAAPTLYLIDRPGAIQSAIFAAELAPPRSDKADVAIETMNNILGGTFTSRINMNLREDKHWSYGVHSSLVPARGQRLFLVSAPVQTDKTTESVAELQRELSSLIGSRPITPVELAKAQKDQELKLAGAWETLGHVTHSVAEMVTFGLPSDYFIRYPEKVQELTLLNVEAAARDVVHPKRLVWVVIGDRAKIGSGLRELGFHDIRELDERGQPLLAKAK
jgi:zinc protease